ncbi:MAG: hypothetical protein ABFR32_10550 [Bacteroidota bacterium]
MHKEIFYRITAFLMLVTLMVPISVQFIHAFETHSFQEQFSDNLDHIQNTGKDCAIFHQQINHNVIDLHFDFELKDISFFNEAIPIIVSETVQIYTRQKSPRAPPISFV